MFATDLEPGMDMIEQVARAIAKAQFGNGAPIDPEDWNLARAAIEAMREPNKPMLHAAAKAMSPDRRPTPERVSVKEKHRIRYRAMIDAALSPKPEDQ